MRALASTGGQRQASCARLRASPRTQLPPRPALGLAWLLTDSRFVGTYVAARGAVCRQRAVLGDSCRNVTRCAVLEAGVDCSSFVWHVSVFVLLSQGQYTAYPYELRLRVIIIDYAIYIYTTRTRVNVTLP